MKTSYYSCPLLRGGAYYFVPISNSIPKGFPSDASALDMIPDWKTLVGPYKQGLIDEKEYRKRYLKQLDKAEGCILSALEIFQKIASRHNKEIVFLCYEKPDDFCHRHIFAEWLESKTGEHVEELAEPTLF